MRILLVEDSTTAARLVEGLLAEEEERRDKQFRLMIVKTLADATGLLARETYDLILLDLTLPDSHGLNTVEAVVGAAPRTAVVVLTSISDENLGLRALKLGAQDFLVKDETYRKVLLRSINYAYQRNKAEQEIREAKEMAEFATQSKSSFIANLSHELRTPLNAIIGFSEMMTAGTHGDMPPKYREYAHDIHKSGRYLLGLIGTVLDMSKIEAQKVEIHDDEVDLVDLIRECLTEVSFEDRASTHPLIFDPPETPPVIRVDKVKMMQVFCNLIANAIKYSPDGGEVAIAIAPTADGGLSTAVSDRGIGIPADQIDRVLRPFGRSQVARQRKIEGTGLGLPLTKGLIEAHGGRLAIDSAPGAGTTVTVTLPPTRVVAMHQGADI